MPCDCCRMATQPTVERRPTVHVHMKGQPIQQKSSCCSSQSGFRGHLIGLWFDGCCRMFSNQDYIYWRRHWMEWRILRYYKRVISSSDIHLYTDQHKLPQFVLLLSSKVYNQFNLKHAVSCIIYGVSSGLYRSALIVTFV